MTDIKLLILRILYIGGMKLKYDTKVQSVAGSLTTTVPAFARDLLSLKKGDSLEWIIDTKQDLITVTKKE